MRSRRTLPGNAAGVARENLPVHVIAELMDVVQDLCLYAAVSRLAGRHAWAETLVEQCGDLLAHRASLLARSREGSPSQPRRADDIAGRSLRGTRWTN
jgi:hypothetical protein